MSAYPKYKACSLTGILHKVNSKRDERIERLAPVIGVFLTALLFVFLASLFK